MTRARAWTLLAVSVLAVLAWFLLGSRGDRTAPSPSAADPQGTSSPTLDPVAKRSSPPAPALAPSSSAPSPSASSLVFDRAKRDQMRDLIWRALREPEPETPPPAPRRHYILPDSVPDPPGEGGKLEPSAIQDRVRNDFFGVARQCYADALKKEPGLKGEIVLHFVIVGNANIGGIVESVDVLNRSTLRDPEMIDCMRDQFLSVTFPPPEGGGSVVVTYPIIFSPEDDDGGT